METKTKVIITVISIAVVMVAIIIFSSMTTVPTGFVGVKTRFGKVQDSVIQEGLNLKMPFIEKIVRIDCRTQKLEVTSESSTKDMQTVTVSIALNYNVDKNTANALYQEVGVDYQNIIIQPAILESIKAVMAQYNAEELITKRAEVSNSIKERVIEKISTKGFIITDFNTTNIDFSDAFDSAIEAKAVKQQEVETAKADLEKQKIENEKEIAMAEKDAKVMELKNQQITDNTLKLKIIEKWNGQLPTHALSNNILTMLGL